MAHTLHRHHGPTRGRGGHLARWVRPLAISALASLALTALLGTPAELAQSTGAGLAFLLAFAASGSAAALLQIAETTAMWRVGVGVALVAGVGVVGGPFGIVCALAVVGAFTERQGRLPRFGGSR